MLVGSNFKRHLIELKPNWNSSLYMALFGSSRVAFTEKLPILHLISVVDSLILSMSGMILAENVSKLNMWFKCLFVSKNKAEKIKKKTV
jgi:hypothetical protein